MADKKYSAKIPYVKVLDANKTAEGMPFSRKSFFQSVGENL